MKKNVVPNNGESNNEVEPYKYSKLSMIPSWIKILFLKYWAAGAAVFFFGVGGSFLGLDYGGFDNTTDAIISYGVRFFVLLTIGLALVMNYIVKVIVRYMKTSRDNTYYYNMVNVKGFKGFLLNILYSLLCMVPIFFFSIFVGVYGLLPNLFGDNYEWGLEPFSMGLFYIMTDFVFLFIKNSISGLIKKAKYKKEAKAFGETNEL